MCTYFEFHYPVSIGFFRVRNANGPGLAGDAFDGGHEHVCYYSHSKEAPQQTCQVEEGSGTLRPSVLVDGG